MSPPTAEDQAALIKQFRQRLVEEDLIHDGDTIGTDDWTLVRFLRARQYDLDAATTMWATSQEWRKTIGGVGIDELFNAEDPYDYPEREKVFDYWPMWFHKTDKEGRPLNIQLYGGINMPELYKHITPEKFWHSIVTTAESIPREVMPAASREAGKQIDGTFVIVDLKGFGLTQFWQMRNMVRDSFQMTQDNYPEMMAKFFIINAPYSFTTIWSVVKLWIAKETLAKIDILGSDYKSVLLTHIDPENLPESMGGTCRCEDVGGCKWKKPPRR
ncbi:uncharacterized protein FIBRA_02233 [Fibroporia radiculosa]|uniref:CRAL-TRIO domain-containing protein n=1 Tax=Fibroporia radiculosa TaxID=599839 RepID=J4GMP0_9APHY|nr:uncharacterized protein FIBRA_02233 [Fibroporia radiculosa]CCM00205.1 predicted protein [Fibroporia radiculosa]